MATTRASMPAMLKAAPSGKGKLPAKKGKTAGMKAGGKVCK